ncbi:MAG TPA: polysaccharide deacetylase family protein [Burkholderiales bacterium]|nr:polysaccharide deacetylase family protein [Burkholderiales bacterium]
MAATGVTRLLLRAQALIHRHGYVRVLNYHDTPPQHAGTFEQQVRFYAEHFTPVGLGDLGRFFGHGFWPAAKPGLIISFDDGLLSNYEVAAPILERYGFTGWFFVATALLESGPEEQAGLGRGDNRLLVHCWPEHGRLVMSAQEARALAARHVIGSHTRTHRRMSSDVAAEVMEDEIAGARAQLEAQLGAPVDAFAWVGGEEGSYSAEAARIIRRAGYSYAFMTNSAPVVPGTNPFQIQRTNIEASWPLDVVRFQVSGIMDALYLPKRTRVNRLTSV